MALTDDEQATLKRLKSRLDADIRGTAVNGMRIFGLELLRSYYRGIQRLAQLGLAVPDELRQFVTIVNWPRTYVDAIATRLRIQGFILDGEADDEIWSIWQSNDLDTEIRMAIVDMLAYRRGYLCGGTSDESDGDPLLTVESPFQMTHGWSNRYRKVTDAARFYCDVEDGKKVRRATLYMPNSNVWCVRGTNGQWVEDPDESRDDHGLGKVLVYPLVNRASSDDRYGESEMSQTILLTDAAARALTNAQVATEVMALPQRWAAGMSQADFKDPATGEQLTQWEAYFGSVWVTAKENAKFGQFDAARLENFKAIVELYQGLISGTTGLPLRYLGQNSANPPSADGIRADESRIVGTAEEKQQFIDGPLEQAMRDARQIKTGDDDPDLARLETVWRDAATPTVAQAADAGSKLFQSRIYSRREVLRQMGKSPQQIAIIEQEIEDEADDPILQAALKDVAGAGAPGGA